MEVIRRRAWTLVAALLVAPPAARPDEPPVIEHQPNPCTVPENPFAICAAVRDDMEVAKARIYFRPEGEKYYSIVEMAFGGITYCGTLPAPRQGKLKAVEYYIQAVDDQYQSQRTSTFRIIVQPEGVCEFPPVEKDPRRAASIVVHATHWKQGKKLPGGFVGTGVSFVPATGQ